MKEIKTLEEILLQKQKTEQQIVDLIKDFLNSTPLLKINGCILNCDYSKGTLSFTLIITL